MRAKVMAQASDLVIRISNSEIHPEELVQMDEIFITNSLIGIWPVGRFAGRDFSLGELTRGLQSVLQTKLEELV
jgi:4-amino-4-deoxychorismate lyase